MSKLKVLSTDNRDINTTWIWLQSETDGVQDFVEIDPLELYDNAIENSPIGAGLAELKGYIASGSTSWDDVYEWDIVDYQNRLDQCTDPDMAECLFEYIQYHMFGQTV